MAKAGPQTPDPQEDSKESPDESTGQAPAPAEPKRAEATSSLPRYTPANPLDPINGFAEDPGNSFHNNGKC